MSGFGLAGGPVFAVWLLLIAFATALTIAALHLAIAVPLYFLLARFVKVGWGTAALAGFLIGSLPVIALTGGLGRPGIVAPMLLFGLPGLAGGLAFAWRMEQEEI